MLFYYESLQMFTSHCLFSFVVSLQLYDLQPKTQEHYTIQAPQSELDVRGKWTLCEYCLLCEGREPEAAVLLYRLG